MKPKLIFRGPVTTASGCGVHARQILHAIINMDKYDICVSPIMWGQTPFVYDDNKFFTLIREFISKYEKNEKNNVQYDISVQVTIPNEFLKLAKINIGVTAGIETDKVSCEWISKINDNVDLVIVPSKHSAETLINTVYNIDGNKDLRVCKPVVIIPEGVDTTLFNTLEINTNSLMMLDDINSEFNFLFVGLGLDNRMGEDRKNISLLIKWFCEKFKDDENVGLVLKIGIFNNSLLDFETCKNKISDIKRLTGCNEFPRIHLLHGRLLDGEMAELYKHNKIKAFISLTHGEGYGLPIIEAAACGLPIMATNWSGHLDFLHIGEKKYFVPIDYKLEEIPQSVVRKGVMEISSKWAIPDEDDAKIKMNKIVFSYEKPNEWASVLASHIKENYSLEKIYYDFSNTLNSFLEKQYASDHSISA